MSARSCATEKLAMNAQDPMTKSSEDYTELIEKIAIADSPVGIDAKLTHAIIIDYLQQIMVRLDNLERRAVENE